MSTNNHTLPTTKQRDPDFVKAETAIKRASLKARERARKFGIGVVIMKEDRIVEECADGTLRPAS